MSLAILPALTGGRVSNGSVRLTHKFIDGMKLCAECSAMGRRLTKAIPN